jgi:hypothetical protein
MVDELGKLSINLLFANLIVFLELFSVLNRLVVFGVMHFVLGSVEAR